MCILDVHLVGQKLGGMAVQCPNSKDVEFIIRYAVDVDFISGLSINGSLDGLKDLGDLQSAPDLSKRS